MKKLILMSLMLLTTHGMAATPGDDLLRTSDALAMQEAETIQTFYWEGLQHWQAGDSIAALNAFDYAAWHGSHAAALRLCVMDGLGVGGPVNAPKAAFWCSRAAAAGHDITAVHNHLQRTAWVASQ